MAAPFGATAAASTANPNNSFEVPDPPDDSILSLSFSPKANFLVAISWDNQFEERGSCKKACGYDLTSE